uniref:Uncharacterized protein n=1 Tax=Anopheles albimanus TaxID=7167 RepID=A0A182FC89_ANOAL
MRLHTGEPRDRPVEQSEHTKNVTPSHEQALLECVIQHHHTLTVAAQSEIIRETLLALSHNKINEQDSHAHVCVYVSWCLCVCMHVEKPGHTKPCSPFPPFPQLCIPVFHVISG